MNSIEDRIRAATRAAGETVRPDSVPPLRAMPVMPAPAWRRAGSRWLVPAAAAAAIAAIAIGALAIAGKPHTRPVAGGQRVSSYVSGGQVPPYYVAIQADGNPRDVPSYAVVRATATGNLLATIKPAQPGYTMMAVTAAADDRTFVLDEARWVGGYANPNLGQNWQTRSFFLLRLDFAGAQVSLSRLPMTAGKLVTGMALSPDGTKLAVAVHPQPQSARDMEEVRIYTLATGAFRTWTAQGLVGTGLASAGDSGGGWDDAGSLSWTANSTRLAFDWTPPANGGSPAAGTWLLNPALAGASLLADSRQVQSTDRSTAAACADSLAVVWTCDGDAIVTPDGSAVVTGQLKGLDPPGDGQAEFAEISTATGKVTHVLGPWSAKGAAEATARVLWSSPSGDILIGAIPDSGNGQVGIIKGSTFTPLNVPDDALPGLGEAW